MLAVSKLLEKAWEICMDHLGGPRTAGVPQVLERAKSPRHLYCQLAVSGCPSVML